MNLFQSEKQRTQTNNLSIKLVVGLTITLSATLLVLNSTLPGLGFGWSVKNSWVEYTTSWPFFFFGLLLSATTGFIAFTQRDWRYVPPILSVFAIALAFQNPFSTQAELLTAPSGFEVYKSGGPPDPDLTVSELSERVVSLKRLPLNGVFAPEPVGLEALTLRAIDSKKALEPIVMHFGEVSVVDFFKPPKIMVPEPIAALESALNEATNALEEASQRLSAIGDCPTPIDGQPDGACEHQKSTAESDWDSAKADQTERNNLLQAAKDRNNAIPVSQAATELRHETVQLAWRILSTQETAVQEARDASFTYLASLCAAFFLFLSGLLAPGITWSIAPILLAAVAHTYFTSEPKNLFSDDWMAYSPVAHAIFFSVFFLIARVLHVVTIANWPILKVLKPFERWEVLRLVLWRSTWVFAILCSLLAVSTYFDEESRHLLYNIPLQTKVVPSEDCEKGKSLIFRQHDLAGCAARRPESDTRASMRWHIAKFEREASFAIAESSKAANASVEALADQTRALFDTHVQKRLSPNEGKLPFVSSFFNDEDCDFPLKIANCIKDAITSPAREKYKNAFDRVEVTFKDRVANIVTSSNGNINYARLELTKLIRQTTDDLILPLDLMIKKAFRVLDVSSMVGFVFLTIALIKALLHITFRCLCAPKGLDERLSRNVKNVMGELDKIAAPFTPEQVATSSSSTFFLQPGTTYRLRSTFKPVNAIPDSVLPRILFAPRGAFKRYAMPLNSDAAPLGFAMAVKVVTVRLEANQTLAFIPSAMVGFEESVKFKSAFLRRVLDILSGRIRTVLAQGPGDLILQSEGETVVLPKQGEAGPFHALPLQIIAWSPSVQFVTRADKSMKELYMNPPHVRPLEDGVAVVDTARRSGKGPRPIGLLGALTTQF
jgi:hypothetical protein